MPIIQTKNLTKIYKMRGENIIALDHVELEINKGEFVCVMGRSGSGKSTLLNMLGALDSPTSGEVIIEGQSLKDINKSELHKVRRNKIGFIFQEFNLIPTLTALENVELSLRYAGVNGKERQQRAVDILTQVELGNRLHHKPDELSGGQKQRVAIARALVNNPAIILADEPTGELDSTTSEQLVSLIRRLNKDLRQTFLIVTHDEEIKKHANRIIVLKDGKVLESGKNLGLTSINKVVKILQDE